MVRLTRAVALALLLALPGAALVARGDAGLTVIVDGSHALADAAPYFANYTLTAAPAAVGAPCATAGACIDVPLHVDAPAGAWDALHGGVEITVRAVHGNVAFTVLDATGATVATGTPSGLGGALVQTTAPLSDTVAILRGLPTGDYTIRLSSTSAPVAFTLVAQRDTRPQQPASELLPDLVVLPILNVDDTWRATKVGLSCRPLEVATLPAAPPTRCLRFDTTVGNVGPGGFYLSIPQLDAANGLLCNTNACPLNVPLASFTQDVERSDYSMAHYPVSQAIYHVGHDHYHIRDFVVNTLYAYDTATHTRGAVIGLGHKDGFCPIDDYLIALGMPDTQAPSETKCQVNGGDITIRLDSNFLDIYPSSIDDQFVDISNVAPGTYELVTVVNPDHVMHEASTSNNEASVLVQIDANGVRSLGAP